jgi:hypothetical protein
MGKCDDLKRRGGENSSNPAPFKREILKTKGHLEFVFWNFILYPDSERARG